MNRYYNLKNNFNVPTVNIDVSVAVDVDGSIVLFFRVLLPACKLPLPSSNNILLLLVHPKHHHPGMPSLTDTGKTAEERWTNSNGAQPYEWDSNLDMVNRVLKILESQATCLNSNV